MQRVVAAVFFAASFFLPFHGFCAEFSRAPAGYFRYTDLGIAQFRFMVQSPMAPENALRSELAGVGDERAVMNAMVFKVLDNIPNPYPKVIFDDSQARGFAGIHVALQYDIHLN